MDRVILNIPKIETVYLRDILQKEEEKYCSISRTYHFYIITSQFFKKIKELEKKIYENRSKILKKEKDYLLNFINEFKEEHYRKVMEEKKFSCYLVFSKKENVNFGLFGWIPKFCAIYLVSFKDVKYEERKKHCFLTEEEEKFRFGYKEKFNFFLFFLKTNIFMMVGIIYLPKTLLNTKENTL